MRHRINRWLRLALTFVGLVVLVPALIVTVHAQTFSAQIQQFWNMLRTGALSFQTLSIATGGTIAFPSAGAGTVMGFSGGALTLTRSGLAITSAPALTIQNLTAATSGTTVQMSPRSQWCGTAWNSVALASETDCFLAEVLPATNAGATTAVWRVMSSLNGAVYANIFQVASNGAVAGLDFTATASGFNIPTVGYFRSNAFGNRITMPADSQFNFLSNSLTTGFGLDSSVDATMKVRTRAQTGYATVDALGFSVSGVAGATHAPCSVSVTAITVTNGIITSITCT